MNKETWIENCRSINSPIEINTLGGYTYEQVINNKNCSKNPKFWFNILGTEKFLFQSSIAESWEFYDEDVENPIANTNQIYIRFLNVTPFVEPSNYYRKHKTFTHFGNNTIGYDKYWSEIEQKILNGFEVDGVKITGRHYFTINFSQFRAIPVDENGTATSVRKIWTFLRFIDLQYYLFHELEECFLEGPYRDKEEYLNFFPSKDIYDFLALKLQNFASTKGRRKGWTAAIAAGVFNYNFTFVASSMNILAANEKSHYTPMLRAIHTTKTFLNKNTPFVRVTDILGQSDHFIAGIKTITPDGISINEGYLSEINAVSFKDNPFKAIGDSASVINIEEPGKFDRLIEAYPISFEPLVRDGELLIGNIIAGGCVCKGTEVMKSNSIYTNIENIKIEDSLLSYNLDKLEKENISWVKPITKKECFRIVTSNNHSIDCSYDHPLLWSKNHYLHYKTNGPDIKKVTFKRAVELKVGEQLMFVSNRVAFGTKKMWNPRLVGLLIGDGSYGFGGGTQLAVGEEEIYDWIIKNNIRHTVTKKKITTTNNWYRQISLGGIRKELKNLGIFGQTKDKKTLPLNIEEYDENSIKELIAGYFDADGNITYNKKKDNVKIRLTCAYEPMLKEVQKLLYKFNIESRIEQSKRITGFKTTNAIYYDLVIYKRYDAILFKNTFNLISNKKRENLNKLDESKSSTGRYDKCLFEINPSNNKGIHFDKTYFRELRSLFIKEIIPLGLQDVYNLTADTTHTYLTNGFISANTAGDIEGGGSSGLYEILYSPSKFGFKEYNNIYEEIPTNQKVGWFIDDIWYSPNRISKVEFLKLDSSKRTIKLLEKIESKLIDTVDEQGNSYRYFSEFLLDEKRKQKRGISNLSYLKFITQQPKYLSEAFLMDETSPFDTNTAKQALGELISKYDTLQIEKGNFYINTESGKKEIAWQLDFNAPIIDEFPWKGVSTTGNWVLYKRPVKVNGIIPSGRYLAGTDPIDWGSGEVSENEKHSLAVTYIIDSLTRNIVAEYISRPELSEHYYEQLWRGIEFYKAELLYENNLKGLYTYFKNKGKAFLLAEEPISLGDKHGYNRSKNPKKGFHATEAINKYARESINVWSLEEVIIGQDEEGEHITIPRMFTIPSKGLLQEIFMWTKKGNFDRISGLGALMLLLFDRDISDLDTSSGKGKLTQGKLFQNLRNKMNKHKNNKTSFNIIKS